MKHRFCLLLVFLTFLLQCKISEEDRQKVNKMAEELPEQIADSVDVTYSEEGDIKMQLDAPKLVMKDDRDETYNEFPEGLHITFYDDQGMKNADLYANYGYDDQRKRERYVKDSVLIITDKGERFTTNELYIDERRDSVYNNGKYVKLTKPDGTIIQGMGFTSDTRMERIRINSIRNSQVNVENMQKDSTNQIIPE